VKTNPNFHITQCRLAKLLPPVGDKSAGQPLCTASLPIGRWAGSDQRDRWDGGDPNSQTPLFSPPPQPSPEWGREQKALTQGHRHITNLPPRALDRQAGVSLVEIMVALTVGLVLIAGVGQIYLSSKQTYRVQDAQSRLQENARYALELLQRDVREAGYLGCRSITSITPNVIANPPIIPLTTSTTVTGNEATGSTWSPGSAPADTVAGTDTITIQSGGSCGGHLVGNMTAVNANIQIDAANSCNLTAGDAFVISDCTNADIARASSVSNGTTIETIAHANNVNTANFLSKAYQSDAELLKFTSYTYFIRNGASGQPALWRVENSAAVSNPEELVEGVENMQVWYGEDTDNDGTPNRYVPANSVTNWGSILSVRIQLLFRTLDDNLTTAAQAFSFNGATVSACNRRLCRAFTSTIGIRNRLQ
jgi:type IV pilus assembly protein PilW